METVDDETLGSPERRRSPAVATAEVNDQTSPDAGISKDKLSRIAPIGVRGFGANGNRAHVKA